MGFRSDFTKFRREGVPAFSLVVLAVLLLAGAAPAEDGAPASGVRDPQAAAGPTEPPPPPLHEDPEPCPRAASVFGLVLGFDAPLRGSRRVTPILGVRNLLYGAVGENSRFDGSLDTHVGRVSLRFALRDRVWVRVPFSATYQWAQLAPLRYEDGARLDDLEVYASRYHVGLDVGAQAAPDLEVWASAGRSRLHYSRSANTGEGLVKPRDHWETAFKLDVRFDRMSYFQNWQIAEGWEAGVTGQYLMRHRWRQWGPPGDPQTSPSEDREFAGLFGFARRSFRFLAHHDLRLSLEAGTGWDLDVLSGFRLGSLVGELQVPGYYYGELPADRYVLLGIRYGMNPWRGGRFWVSAKAGGFRDLDRRHRDVFGVSMGLGQKLFSRCFLVVEYGWAPLAERPGGRGGAELRAVLIIGPIYTRDKR